jgi:hypothetical protein
MDDSKVYGLRRTAAIVAMRARRRQDFLRSAAIAKRHRIEITPN